MAQLRQQFIRQIAVTAAATSTTTVDIFGPESTLAPAYAENTDHVIKDRQNRQNESGFAVIDGWDTSALDAAALTVSIEIWSRAAASPQKGLDGALFPSGATAAANPVLKRVVVNGLAGNDDGLLSAFGGGFGGTPDKDVPLLAVRADEFIRLVIVNSAGALGPVTLSVKYDLGMNPADTNRLA